MLSGEIFSDDRYNAHRREVACHQREVRRCTAQAVIHLAVRSLNAIERNRSHNENCHDLLLTQ
jgi:molybdenum cofactor biosynthesis enzyme